MEKRTINGENLRSLRSGVNSVGDEEEHETGGESNDRGVREKFYKAPMDDSMRNSAAS